MAGFTQAPGGCEVCHIQATVTDTVLHPCWRAGLPALGTAVFGTSSRSLMQLWGLPAQ